jgi:hypothetical protein
LPNNPKLGLQVVVASIIHSRPDPGNNKGKGRGESWRPVLWRAQLMPRNRLVPGLPRPYPHDKLAGSIGWLLRSRILNSPPSPLDRGADRSTTSNNVPNRALYGLLGRLPADWRTMSHSALSVPAVGGPPKMFPVPPVTPVVGKPLPLTSSGEGSERSEAGDGLGQHLDILV